MVRIQAGISSCFIHWARKGWRRKKKGEVRPRSFHCLVSTSELVPKSSRASHHLPHGGSLQACMYDFT